METLELNGKKYIAYSDFEEALKDKEKNRNTRFSEFSLVDESNVWGLGTISLGDDSIVCRFNIGLFSKVIKLIKDFGYDGTEENIYFCFSKGKPMGIGSIDVKEMKLRGVVLAPSISDSDKGF